MTIDPSPEFGRRPAGVSDDTVEAVGAVSEALEWVERARGQACDKLRNAGHDGVADRLSTEMVGRNVLYGRWTFQIVEEFDDRYWTPLREHEHDIATNCNKGNATCSRPK